MSFAVMDEGSDGWIVLRLCDPETRNSLRQQTMSGLIQALSDAAADPNINGIVWKATGSFFCSGANLHDYAELFLTESPEAAKDVTTPFFEALYNFPKPMIAVVWGGARAAGVGLVASCDYTIAVQTSGPELPPTFAVDGVALGIPPLPILPALGRRMSKQSVVGLVTQRRAFHGVDARHAQLVDGLSDPEHIDRDLAAVKAKFMRNAPKAFTTTKQALSPHVDWRKLKQDFLSNMTGPEAREGLMSFRDKRIPTWNRERLTVRALRIPEIKSHFRAITDIRMAVFSAWPYLYDGNLEDEDEYLRHFERDPETLVLGAFDDDKLVGVSTASRWETHPENLLEVLPGAWADVPVTSILYLAESVLLPKYRGSGLGRQFFEAREAFARTLGRAYVAFASVVRRADDPRQAADYRSLEPWWRRLGYKPVPGALCAMDWQDHGDAAPHAHHLQVWIKEL